MHPTNADIAPAERVREIAEILATGYLRLMAEKRAMAPQPSTDECLTENQEDGGFSDYFP